MDSFELNKIAASAIIALLVGMVANLISHGIVSPKMLEKNVLEIALSETDETGNSGATEAKTLEPIEPLLSTANLENGEKLAKKVCAQCHSFEEGGTNKIGPNLWNIVGSKIAQKEGFSYSAAFKAQAIDWSYDNLNKLIAKPRDFIPGTKMSFIGLPKTQDRADVVAYLRTLSRAPLSLP